MGHALLRLQKTVGIGYGFHYPGAGGADRHDTTAFPFCLVDDVGIFGSQFVMFAVHLVLSKVFYRNILECSGAHMQGDFGHIDALRLQGLKHFFAKVEACRRGCYRTGILCKNRLVGQLIVFIIGAVNVRRQRNVTFPVHHRFQFHRRHRKTEHPGAVFLDVFHNGLDAGDFKFATNLESLAGANLGLIAGLSVFCRN